MSTSHRGTGSTTLQNDVTTQRRAISRGLGLVVVVLSGACPQAPSEDPPAAAEAPALDAAPDAAPETTPEATPEAGPLPDTPSPGPGGLGALTRELVEHARRTTRDPLRLVPDAAQYLVQVRPAELLAHAELQTLWTKAEDSDADMRTTMDVVRTCLGRLEAIEQIVLGFDDEEHAALAAHAKGIGTEATWRCLRDETIARGRPFEITLTETPRGKGPQLRQIGGKSDGDLGYFVDDDTVVLLTKEWDAEVGARLRGEGTAAIEGQLAAVASRVPQDASLWVVGRITGKAERNLAGTPMAGIDDVSFSLRVQGRDLELGTAVDAGEAADATHMRDELRKQFDQFKSVLPMLGFPGSVGPKIEFVTEGDLVSLQLVLTGDELEGLREGIERSF